ncbi:MAG: MFS transporter [Spirochaetales bacterium]|nr:MFS transporter [Spirochaetales bacterium]
MNHRIGRNIGLDYSFTFLSNLNLLHALWMIWLSLRGFSLLELGLLEGIFHATSFLMEVPTGAVADLWGRRNSRVLGRLFFLLSIFFLWQADSFLFQAVGFALTAIGYNLESGAGDALVYDSLAHLQRDHEYMGIKGKKELIYQCASVTAFLTGGYIATRNYNYVFSIVAVVAVLSLINALFMVEPPIKKTAAPVEGSLIKKILGSLIQQTRDSLLVIKKEPRIAFLIVYTEAVFVFVTTQYFYLQTWWKFAGYTEWYMGVVFACQGLLAGLSAVLAPKLDKRFGEEKLLAAVPVLLLISLWGTAVFSVKGVFFILIGAFEGILMVTVSDYINKLIPSEFRATILSYQSMVFSLLMILLFPVIGWIGDLYSLDVSLYIIAGTGSAVFLLYKIFESVKRVKQ